MFPNSRTRLPRRTVGVSERDFAGAISSALRREFGVGGAAAKHIQRWTGASDKSARNWLNGASSPRGHHLMILAGHSDEVLMALITMMNRPELALMLDVHAVEVALAKASGAIELVKRHRIAPR